MSEIEYWLDTAGGDKLYVKRFAPSEGSHGTPVLMIHGSIENGKIFYSKSGKGLAPYLCRHGYDVFVPDLRGRGKSHPSIHRESSFGNYEIICEDLPAYTQLIADQCQGKAPFWSGHSWGGVLLMSLYARQVFASAPAGLVTFGTKRRITIQSIRKFYMIDFFWVFISRLLKWWYGYLPAAKIGMGSDNETIKTHEETHALVVSKQWIDPVDNFDYQNALQHLPQLPSFFITGSKDDVLGHPKDVKLFMKEANLHQGEFFLAGTENGLSHDYDHINLLTHPFAEKDTFPLVMNWAENLFK